MYFTWHSSFGKMKCAKIRLLEMIERPTPSIDGKRNTGSTVFYTIYFECFRTVDNVERKYPIRVKLS